MKKLKYERIEVGKIGETYLNGSRPVYKETCRIRLRDGELVDIPTSAFTRVMAVLDGDDAMTAKTFTADGYLAIYRERHMNPTQILQVYDGNGYEVKIEDATRINAFLARVAFEGATDGSRPMSEILREIFNGDDYRGATSAGDTG